MTVAYWIVAGLVAATFLGSGLTKWITPKADLLSKGMAWVEDFSAPSIKAISTAELLGAIGLIVPPLTGVVPVLGPIAGVGLAGLMIGATVVHTRRRETAIPPIVMATLALAAAVLGFAVFA
jgi:hypothetical protein